MKIFEWMGWVDRRGNIEWDEIITDTIVFATAGLILLGIYIAKG